VFLPLLPRVAVVRAAVLAGRAGPALLRVGHPARLSRGLRQPVRVHDHRPAHEPDPRPDVRLGRPAGEVLRLTMSSIIADATTSANSAQIPLHASPARRAWRRFCANRLGYASLLVFVVLFGVSLIAELIFNYRP